MTPGPATVLGLSMNDEVLASVTLFVDEQAEPHRYHVWVDVPAEDLYQHTLLIVTDMLEAAGFMNKWVHNRGLTWARDSARRLDEAKRTDAVMLTLDCVHDHTRPHTIDIEA